VEKTGSLFWVTLIAEAFALMHARLKKLVKSPMETSDVIEGIGRVVRARNERWWVGHT